MGMMAMTSRRSIVTMIRVKVRKRGKMPKHPMEPKWRITYDHNINNHHPNLK